MGNRKKQRHDRRPGILDRVEIWISSGRVIDGLWIGVSFESDPEPALRRVEEALKLIKKYDRLRYNRVTRDLKRVWVRLCPGVLGAFNAPLQACELNIEFVLSSAAPLELIAGTIVHEASHARIHGCGIDYREELRLRVEALCIRRELAFAAKLPDGEKLSENATRALALCSDNESLTDAALWERHDKEQVETLRNLGVPLWLLQCVLKVRKLRVRITRAGRRLWDRVFSAKKAS